MGFQREGEQQVGALIRASTIQGLQRGAESLSRNRLNPYRLEDGFWARLSGPANPYSFEEVTGTATGTGGISWATVTGGLSGGNAFEINNAATLAGKVAWLEYTEIVGVFRFVYPRLHGTGDCSQTTVIGTIKLCNQNLANGVALVLKDSHGTTIVTTITNSIPAGQFILGFKCVQGETYTITISKTGYTTITQVMPIICCGYNNFTYHLATSDNPTITVNFHVAGCESGEIDAACAPCINTQSRPGIETVVVGVTVDGKLVSCVTNPSGDCSITFPCNLSGARYPVSADGGACVTPYVHNVADDVLDSCATETVTRCIVMPTDPRCHCFCCQNPRPDPLFLTDSVYGMVRMDWTGSEYSGAKLGAFAGGCGCPAALTSIDYTLRCGCNTGPPCILGNCETTYGLTICYSAYSIGPTCDCPGPVSPILHPVTACNPAHGNPACAPNIILLDGIIFQNVTAKCAVPLNVVFTRGNACPGVLTCGAGVSCPSPWVGPASWTVTE